LKAEFHNGSVVAAFGRSYGVPRRSAARRRDTEARSKD